MSDRFGYDYISRANKTSCLKPEFNKAEVSATLSLLLTEAHMTYSKLGDGGSSP